MTLQEQPDELRQRSAIGRAAETRAILHRATEDARRSGILARMLRAGDTAPEFALPNANGSLVSSKQLLGQRSLVVSFYRGRW